MRELLDKIEANAAVHLSLPPGRLPAQELARYKTFLKVETHRLKMMHRAGAGGLQVCRARAALIDVLLRYLWDTARQNLSDQAQKEFRQVAVAAIWGSGHPGLNSPRHLHFYVSP